MDRHTTSSSLSGSEENNEKLDYYGENNKEERIGGSHNEDNDRSCNAPSGKV